MTEQFCGRRLAHGAHGYTATPIDSQLDVPGVPQFIDCPGWTIPEEADAEPVDHPAHYGGVDDPYEAIKVIQAWELGFNLGNTVKYISRAGKKDPTKLLEDLRKARWYLDYEINTLEGQ